MAQLSAKKRRQQQHCGLEEVDLDWYSPQQPASPGARRAAAAADISSRAPEESQAGASRSPDETGSLQINEVSLPVVTPNAPPQTS
jgi:hypothetical protein